jgi:hypothetical protein
MLSIAEMKNIFYGKHLEKQVEVKPSGPTKKS